MSDQDQDLMEQVEAATSLGGKLDDAAQDSLLLRISEVVEEGQVDMSFPQALQAVERCQYRLQQEREIYAYFNAVINGNAPINDISIATEARDEQGRPIVAKIPLLEVLTSEVESEERRAEVVRPFFTMINNYYAKRVTQWVQQTAVYAAIAATRMPQSKS